MPSTLLLAEHRQVLDSLDVLARRDLLDLWRTLDGGAEATTNQLLADLPPVIDKYGAIAGDMAVDLYDSVRFDARAVGRFRAVATTVPQGQIDAMIRWAVGPLWSSDPDPALALTNLDGGVTRLTLAPGRDTIVESTKADPANPRYARTPEVGACEFCLMLAGRGAVYAEDTAEFEAHDRCKCGAVPIFDGDTAPEF